MKLQHFPNSDKGFTLTELMVVVSIAVILTGFGYSGFSAWQKRQVVSSAAFQLFGDLREARALAIEKHFSHTISFALNGTRYQYTIFVDTNANGALDVGETVVRLATVNAIRPEVTLTFPTDDEFNNNVAGRDRLALGITSGFSTTSSFIRYDKQGMPRGNLGTFPTCTILIADDNTGYYRYITVSSLGRLDIEPRD